jgi:hypothetical protein
MPEDKRRYLKNIENGRVFVWNAHLMAERTKFVECKKDGTVIGRLDIDPESFYKTLDEKDIELSELQEKLIRAEFENESLKQKLQGVTACREVRESELVSMGRADLLEAAKAAGIDKAAQSYRIGKEAELAAAILGKEFKEQ